MTEQSTNEKTMRLYLAQCGSYPAYPGGAPHETHLHILIAAENPEDAVRKVRRHEIYRTRELHAHVDGLQEIREVDGYSVLLALAPEGSSADGVVTIDSPWKIEQALKSGQVE
jgi:hypothetical protein